MNGSTGIAPSRVADSGSDPNWIRIQSGQWIRIRIRIRIRIQEVKIDPQKKKKISCFEVLDVLF
jgi:hypothetical protein